MDMNEEAINVLLYISKWLLSGSDCNKLNDEKDIIIHMWLTLTIEHLRM